MIHHPSLLWASWTSVPQPWRLVTCYLLTGPGLALLFDPYFLYQYMAMLETSNSRFSRKVDLVWYLIFVCSTILVSFGPFVPCPAPASVLAPNSPHHICPDSALPLLLSRFLKMRKITPALRTPIIRKTRVSLRCRHGGMLWMARMTSIHSSGFL